MHNIKFIRINIHKRLDVIHFICNDRVSDRKLLFFGRKWGMMAEEKNIVR